MQDLRMASKGRDAADSHINDDDGLHGLLNHILFVLFMRTATRSKRQADTHNRDPHPPAWLEAGSGFNGSRLCIAPHPPAWHEAGSGFSGSLLP